MVFRKYTNGCEFSLKSTVLYHSIPIILYAARHFTDECGSQGACMCPKGARALVREHKGEAYRSFTNGYATRPKAEGARTLVLTHKARRLARQTIRAAEGVRSPRPPGSSAQQGVSTRWRPKLRQGACTLVCTSQQSPGSHWFPLEKRQPEPRKGKLWSLRRVYRVYSLTLRWAFHIANKKVASARKEYSWALLFYETLKEFQIRP